MGWPWSSSSSEEDAASQKQAQSPSPAELSKAPPSLKSEPTIPSTSSEQRPSPKTREEAAFDDLRGLFTAINPEAASRATESVRNPPPSATEELDGTFYPTTMKCSQAFDLAYYCSSAGGQLNNIYRFGGLRSCTEQWHKWRFCMRTKAMSEDEKKRRIREFYMEQEARKRVGRSSERVWELRTEPVVGAFSKKVEDVERETGQSATGL